MFQKLERERGWGGVCYITYSSFPHFFFLLSDCSVGLCPTMYDTYICRSAVNVMRKTWPSAKKMSFKKMNALVPNVHV